MAKEWAKWFYNSQSWLECRTAYIASVFGLCEDCRDRGIAKPGYIVHHKTELTPENIYDSSITLNWDNLRYLCLDCHNRVNTTEVLREGLMFDSNGQLVEKNNNNN
jgi:5-methylcytosine-specific restriction protein A